MDAYANKVRSSWREIDISMNELQELLDEADSNWSVTQTEQWRKEANDEYSKLLKISDELLNISPVPPQAEEVQVGNEQIASLLFPFMHNLADYINTGDMKSLETSTEILEVIEAYIDEAERLLIVAEQE